MHAKCFYDVFLLKVYFEKTFSYYIYLIFSDIFITPKHAKDKISLMLDVDLI